MELRTPKRYLKPRRNVISLRWLWLWLLTPIVALTGWLAYENMDQLRPPVQDAMQSMMNSAGDSIATVTAPTPLPTQNPTNRLRVADDAWNNGAIDEAVAEYLAVLDNAPNDVRSHYRAALGLIMQGNDREALEIAEQTVTANPFSADAWAIRAAALNANARYGEAIASALQALQLDRESARATAYLAEAYFDSNQTNRALETAERAIDMNPETYEGYYVLGRVHQESTFEFDEAQEAYQTAADIAPNMPNVAVNQAWLDIANEDFDLAIERLQEVVENNPLNIDALYALARFQYTFYGDDNQALDYLSRCVAGAPENIPCNYYLGTVLYGRGENADAAEQFIKVVEELGSTTPRHWLSAGNILITLGNCREALPYLQTGYELERDLPFPDPNNITLFEDGLQQCGGLRQAQPQATAEATVEADV